MHAGRGIVSLPLTAAGALLLLGALYLVMRWERPALADAAAGDLRAGRVILISLDTLRQDHLSLYGYPRPTSPNLEKLAERATVFTNAQAHAPFTLASHMSMFTGVSPRSHDVRFINDVLPDSFVTIAEVLANAGFRTAGFTDGGLMDKKYGFAQGFETYECKRAPGFALKNGFRRRAGQLRDWIHGRQMERFFLFFHTFDTHGPYSVEDEYREALAGTEPVVPEGADRFGEPLAYMGSMPIHQYLKPETYEDLADLIDDYDATIRFVDDQVGRFIDHLEASHLFDDSLIIITSDHGEAFLDHGLYVGHGLTLYEEEIRVPLIVKFPRGKFAGQRCDAVVRLVDLFPTICAAAGVEMPAGLEGADLALAVEGRDPEPRIAFGCNPNVAGHGIDGAAGMMSYVRRGDFKYIDPPRISLPDLLTRHLYKQAKGDPPYDLEADPLGMKQRAAQYASLQVYDLAADPGEHENVAGQRARDVDAVQKMIERIETESEAVRRAHEYAQTGDPKTIDEVREEEENLKALLEMGYISSDEYRVKVARLRMLEQNLELEEDARRSKAGTGAAPPAPIENPR